MPTPLEHLQLPWLWERTNQDPDGFALGFGDTNLSFAGLAARAESSAARMATLGIGPGERVVMVADSSIRAVEIIHAVQRLGGVLVPLNTRLAAQEIAALIEASEPRVIIYDATHAGLLKLVSAAHARIESISEFDALPATSLAPIGPIAPNAVHTIIFTSGTTGMPKGAMLTNGNHFASALASRKNLGAEAADRWLDLLPLHHVGGLSIILRGAIDGAGVILQRGFDAHRANLAVRQCGITLLSLVSTMLTRMLDDNGEQMYPVSLRCVLVGGGPVPSSLVERASRVGVPVAPTYGLTETASQVVTSRPSDAMVRPGSCGRALPGNEIRIVGADADGRGEIAVKGPSVMAGYFRQPSGTPAVLGHGWLLTGDIGHFDDDGFLYIDDRRSDLIVTGGENVYPAEVEAALLAHPQVAEAGAYAVSDPKWGHRVAAAVVLREGVVLSEDDLRLWCAARLARFKVPGSIQFMAALPRTASGKIKRGLLREMHLRDDG